MVSDLLQRSYGLDLFSCPFDLLEFGFLLLNIILRFGIEFGTSKQIAGSKSSNTHSLSIFPIDNGHPVWTGLVEMLLIIILSMVTYLTYKCTLTRSSWRYLQIFCIMGAILSYMLIAVHWVSESNLMALSVAFREIGKTFAPRLVYAIGFALLALLVLSQFSYQRVSASNSAERLAIVTVTMISAWSSTVLILLGRQGPFVALICIAGAWCVVKSQKPAAWMDNTNRTFPGLFIDPISMTQWSLLSICLFFYTGH